MGGATLPTANTPGYGSITRNSRTYVGCDCTIAFLLAGEELGLARGLLREGLDIVQITGNAAASGGVHRLGAAFDVKQYSAPWVVIWREMGAAFWPRLDPNPGIPGDLWDGNEHGHGGIDCPHNELIAYQNLAYRRGYNGLGQGWYGGQYLWGYGAKDNTFRPAIRRSWQQGIAWAKAEAAKARAAKPTPIAPPEDDMFSDTDRATLNQILTALKAHDSEEDGRYKVDSGRYQHVVGLIKGQPETDAQAIADAIPADIAAQVAAELGKRLNPSAPDPVQ